VSSLEGKMSRNIWEKNELRERRRKERVDEKRSYLKGIGYQKTKRALTQGRVGKQHKETPVMEL
jgi:hypothetical protein